MTKLRCDNDKRISQSLGNCDALDLNVSVIIATPLVRSFSFSFHQSASPALLKISSCVGLSELYISFWNDKKFTLKGTNFKLKYTLSVKMSVREKVQKFFKHAFGFSLCLSLSFNFSFGFSAASSSTLGSGTASAFSACVPASGLAEVSAFASAPA